MYFLHAHEVKKCGHVICSANHMIDFTFDLKIKMWAKTKKEDAGKSENLITMA
jgi:hypothetical protein